MHHLPLKNTFPRSPLANRPFVMIGTRSRHEMKQVVVFGGNGFVGQNVCQAALHMGADVVSVNRSGPPAGKGKGWKDTVKWVQADIFKPEDYAAEVGT